MSARRARESTAAPMVRLPRELFAELYLSAGIETQVRVESRVSAEVIRASVAAFDGAVV